MAEELAAKHARRIVVTGLGAVSPYGRGCESLWSGLLSGKTAIGALELFDASDQRTKLAGEVRSDFSDVVEGLHARHKSRLTRADRFALAAAREAVEAAGLDVRSERCGVFLGCNAGGMFEIEQLIMHPGTRKYSSQLSGHLNSSPAEAIARDLGVTGPVEVSASACSAAGMALEAALQSLRTGEVEVAIAGGADALCQLTYSGFNALRAIDEVPCRPFREGREGLSIGEGAGVVILESLEHAQRRGAVPLAEFCGAGSACDAFHMTAPDPEGKGAAAAIRAALRSANLDETDIDFLNLHGTGTPHNDAAEWRALAKVFGDRAGQMPATSTKSAVGHMLGACGGLEAVVTVLSLQERVLHPTTGEGPVDPDCPVDLVLGEGRDLGTASQALSVNLAFGGANVALIFGRLPEDLQ